MALDDKQEKTITLQTLADKGSWTLPYLASLSEKDLGKALEGYNPQVDDAKKKEQDKIIRKKIVSNIITAADDGQIKDFLTLVENLTNINHKVNGPDGRFISLPLRNLLADIIKAYVEKHDGGKLKETSRIESTQICNKLLEISFSAKSKLLLRTVSEKTPNEYRDPMLADMSNQLTPFATPDFKDYVAAAALGDQLKNKNFIQKWVPGILERADGIDDAPPMASDSKMTLETLASKRGETLPFLLGLSRTDLKKASAAYNTIRATVAKENADKPIREQIISSIVTAADKQPDIFLDLIRQLTVINHEMNAPDRFMSGDRFHLLADIIKAYIKKHDGKKFEALLGANSTNEIITGLNSICLSAKSKQLLSTILDQSPQDEKSLNRAKKDVSNKLLQVVFTPLFSQKEKFPGLANALMNPTFYKEWAPGVIKRADGEDEALGPVKEQKSSTFLNSAAVATEKTPATPTEEKNTTPLLPKRQQPTKSETTTGEKAAVALLALATIGILAAVFLAPAAMGATVFLGLSGAALSFIGLAIAFVGAAGYFLLKAPGGAASISGKETSIDTRTSKAEITSTGGNIWKKQPQLSQNNTLHAGASNTQTQPQPAQLSQDNTPDAGASNTQTQPQPAQGDGAASISGKDTTTGALVSEVTQTGGNTWQKQPQLSQDNTLNAGASNAQPSAPLTGGQILGRERGAGFLQKHGAPGEAIQDSAPAPGPKEQTQTGSTPVQ